MDDGPLSAVWSRTTEGLEPWMHHDGLLIAGGPARLAAFEADTGGELWSMSLPDERPNRYAIVDDAIHYWVGYHHLVIDLDLGEIVEDVEQPEHVAESPEAWPAHRRTSYDDVFDLDLGSFRLAVSHDGLRVTELVAEPGDPAYVVSVRHRFDQAAGLVDGESGRAFVALPDGSLWCFSARGEGTPIEPGSRTRENQVAYLADALHLRTTDPLGLRARLSIVDPEAAVEVMLDWAVRGAALASLAAGGFDDAVDELDDIGSLVGWELLPEEASAIGEALSVVWEDDDPHRQAGEVAAVVWTLMAAALAGPAAVESRSVLLVERSRVLAAHPSELPLHEIGGAYPYLAAGSPDDVGAHSLDIRRGVLGLLAAAAAARAVDLAPDADDVLNAVRATGFEVLEALLEAADTPSPNG